MKLIINISFSVYFIKLNICCTLNNMVILMGKVISNCTFLQSTILFVVFFSVLKILKFNSICTSVENDGQDCYRQLTETLTQMKPYSAIPD